MEGEVLIIEKLEDLTIFVGIVVSVSTIILSFGKYLLERKKLKLEKKRMLNEFRTKNFDIIYNFYESILNAGIKATSDPLEKREVQDLFMKLEKTRFFFTFIC